LHIQEDVQDAEKGAVIMHRTKTTHLLTSLAVVALLWACEDEPTPAKTTVPLTSAPENVRAPDTQPAKTGKGPWHRHGDPMLMAMKRHADELGLSEDQKTRIESIIEKAREHVPHPKGEFRVHMEQMGDLIKAETLDRDALTAGHDEMQAGRLEMKTRRFSSFIDALEVLTQDQRTKLFSIVKEHRGKHKGFFKHGGRHSMLLRAIKVLGDDLEQTAEQKQSIKETIEKSRAEAAPLKDKKKALRQEMHALMTAPQLDRAAIEAKHAEILDVKKERSSRGFALTLEALEVLSVDQRVQLVDTLEQCRAAKGEGSCKKLFGHKKGKHFHKGPAAGHMASW
jgi:Spy/CpxP family protein refolding chaperone